LSDELIDLLDAVEGRYRWQSLVVDGHEWRWLDTAAAGPVAILLPGSVGDGGMFAPTLEALGDQARLVAVTYPAISEPAALADGLAALMDHLAIESAVVVGSSFAAWWAQFLALRHPRRVKSLVIGNGFVEGNDLADNPLFDRDYVTSVPDEELHGQWLRRVEASPESPLQRLQYLMLSTRQSPANLKARFVGVVNALPCPPLTLPPQAVTVLDCADDPLIPSAVQARLRQRYPDARHVTLETGAHYPHLLNSRNYERLMLEILNQSSHGDTN
jgi:maspardin